MRCFDFGPWLIQYGFHGGEWSVETFLVEYEDAPEKYHRVVYFGPLCFSWETA